MLYKIFYQIKAFINSLLCRKNKIDNNDEVISFVDPEMDIENL